MFGLDDPFGSISDLTDPGEASYDSVGDFVHRFVNLSVGVGVGLSVIGLIVAGIQFVVSKGDPRGVEKARNALTYAAIAAILSVSVFAVKGLIDGLVGGGLPNELGY
jgi:hypothetical protein